MTAAAPPDSTTEAQVAAALARCAAGDRTALRVIYDAEAPRMVGVARRMLRRQDLAEEAVQDAFMRVWRAAGTFDPQKGAARSWLYAILRNCALSILRDEGRFTSDEDAADLAAPMMTAADAARMVRNCIALSLGFAVARCDRRGTAGGGEQMRERR